MQVQGREQRDLAGTGCDLRFGPCQVFGDFLLQCLQCRQIFLMNTVLGKFLGIAGNEFMILVIRFVKRFFRPVGNQSQFVQRADRNHLLVLCRAVILGTGRRVRICRIPYQIRHD